MDTKRVENFVENLWESSVLPTLKEYIAIPNISPLYDPTWKTNGLIDKAADLLFSWVKKQNVKGLEAEIVRLPERTPVIYITIPPTNDSFKETILMYGHLDKQPPLTEAWDQGLGPYTPVVKDGKLYGRGGADDGYSVFAAIGSILAVQEQGLAHGRIVVLIEAAEESGSPDLPHYVKHLEQRIGTPTLIICLDSGCANYDQMWMTTSLRGLCVANLRVDVMNEGVHSGASSGVVPSSFRIIRQLLDRVEDSATGEVKLKEFFSEIPEGRKKQIRLMADALGTDIFNDFPWADGVKPMHADDPYEALLHRNWKPTLSITGVEGIPNLTQAGNVLRPYTTLKLSLRLPPRGNNKAAGKALKEVLEKDPPYGAKVTVDIEKAADGWDSPSLADWVESSVNKASQAFFGKPTNYMGEGGSIPFMGMLGEKFPQAQFVITGVLGPASNAHGPNEFLHIHTGKRITSCVAMIVTDHFEKFK